MANLKRRFLTHPYLGAALAWLVIAGVVFAQTAVGPLGPAPAAGGTFAGGAITSDITTGAGVGYGVGVNGGYISQESAGTPDQSGFWTGTTGNAWHIAEKADKAFDFAHAQATDPTLFVHSHNQTTTEWLGLAHNGTDGVITTGTGKIKLNGSVGVTLMSSGAIQMLVSNTRTLLGGNSTFGWSLNNDPNVATIPDTAFSRIAAGVIGIVDTYDGTTAGDVSLRTTGTNGGYMQDGVSSELLTLSTTLGATFTDSVGALLPVDSIIQAVTIRVQTGITFTGTAITGLSVGDDTPTALRFIDNYTTLTTAGNKVGLLHMMGSVATDALGPGNPTALKVRITHVGADGTTTVTAGKVRVQVFYKKFVAAAN